MTQPHAGNRLYRLLRELHLCLGLSVSPFVLVLALSVLVLNHGHTAASPVSTRLTGVSVPPTLEALQGAARLKAVRSILDQLGITGEIDFIRQIGSERRLIVPVVKPGVETTVDLQLDTGVVTVTRKTTGMPGVLAWLHRFPGPHNDDIRGNWLWTRCWRWLADGTIYLLLFVSASGIYLWAVPKAERKIGFVLIGAGAASFFGLIYGLCL
jgi:hypothetical protein